MGRGKQAAGSGQPGPRRSSAALTKEEREALSPAVARALSCIAPHLPPQLYLGGGTATALYLHYRVSRDLDFFYHQRSVDLDALEHELTALGAAVTLRAPGTLRMQLGDAKVEFLHADEERPQHQLERPKLVAGVPVAGIKDLMAMKLEVLGERGELRDYYDVMQIDEHGDASVEDGIAFYLERYGLDRTSDALPHLIRSLGYLEDTEEDEEVPMSKKDLAAWWRRRQAQVIRNLGL